MCGHIHIHIYIRILFNLKKEGSLNTCYAWMNLEDIMLHEVSQTQRKLLHYSTSKVPGVVRLRD